MIIQLSKQYRLKAVDSHNIATQKLFNDVKNNKTYWVPFEYFGSLRGALKSVLDSPRYLTGKSSKECKEWMEKIRDIIKRTLIS